MSVPKGDRTPTDKRFLTGEALKLLCSHTIRITQNEKHFPKRSRWIITGPIVKAAVNAYRHASAANGIEIQTWEDYKARRDHQVKTRAHLESLLSLIEIAEETLSLESEKVRYWVSLVNDGMKMLEGWRKSDRDRYRAIIRDGKATEAARAEQYRREHPEA